MKIIYLHQYFRTPSMSGGTRSYEMARRLVAKGHQVEMITSGQENLKSRWTESEEAGIRVHWGSVPYSNTMGIAQRIQSFCQFAWMSAQRAMEIGGDIIFASSTPLTIALPGIYASRRLKIPMVLEVRDLWPEAPIAIGALKNRLAIAAARRLELSAYRYSKEIVALSPDMSRGIQKRGIPSHKITIIPNSCDFDLFDVSESAGNHFRQRHEWLGDRRLVVYTGTLGQVNGVSYLVRAAAAARNIDPELRFLIVGEGREKQMIEQLARETGVLNANLFMHPSVQKTEIPAILSAADLTTSTVIPLPELWANSANKIFDGLAAGRPVAINHGGWLSEMIKEWGCGLVLPPSDPEAAAKIIAEKLTDPLWRNSARRQARKAGQALFDRNQLAGLLEEVLLRAAGVSLAAGSNSSMERHAA